MNGISNRSILVFEKTGVFAIALLFQELLIDLEFARCVMPQEDSVNILLRNSKSGGFFILRRLNGLFLFFLGGERVA